MSGYIFVSQIPDPGMGRPFYSIPSWEFDVRPAEAPTVPDLRRFMCAGGRSIFVISGDLGKHTLSSAMVVVLTSHLSFADQLEAFENIGMQG
jgi:hypothetical protein